MGVYLDTSVLLAAHLEESASSAVDEFIISTSQPLLVSDFAAAEVASGVSRLVRMRILSPEDAMAQLRDFDVWRARVTDTVDMSGADARLADVYVRRFDLMLKAPDALHAAIASRLDATLATLDRRLAISARALGLTVVVPGHSA